MATRKGQGEKFWGIVREGIIYSHPHPPAIAILPMGALGVLASSVCCCCGGVCLPVFHAGNTAQHFKANAPNAKQSDIFGEVVKDANGNGEKMPN